MKELPLNQIIQGDCLEVLSSFPAESVDCVITDPPYGVTGLRWDNDSTAWMKEVLRIVKPNGAIVSFGTQPFTSKLIQEHKDIFRYCWIWDKSIAGNPLIANYQPLKIHEDIMVFSKDTHRYFPIMRAGVFRKKGGGKSKLLNMEMTSQQNDSYFPVSILDFSNGLRGEHPTQKPLNLMKYLVETYSKKDDLILDPFAGSGSTLLAAKELKRNFLGIEIDKDYCKIAEERLKRARQPLFI